MLDQSTPTGAKASALLDDAYVIWLTTVNADGQPQSSPVWFVIDKGEFLIYSLDGTARTRNIASNPRVSLNLDSDAGADVVTVEGRARVDVDTAPSTKHAAYQEKYGSGITRIGHTPTSFAAAYSVPLRVSPSRWRVH